MQGRRRATTPFFNGNAEAEGENGKRESFSVISEKREEISSNHNVETHDDARSVVILIVLYMLQGVPLGLVHGSIPFLLQNQLEGQTNYALIGIFSLASWPYSLKLLWSPLVDSLYIPRLGRRKSWIIPAQTVSGVLFICVSYFIDSLMAQASSRIYGITGLFVVLVILAATQDIAVDGWALNLLSKKNIGFASTCQTAGLNAGFFLSFTIFLALNSTDFCNRYLRNVPSFETGLLSLSAYIRFWGFAYLAVSVVLLFTHETATSSHVLSIPNVYRQMWSVVKNKNMQALIAVLLLSKVGFAANDAATALKFLEAGFKREDMALLVLIQFPIEILFAILAGQWSSTSTPLSPWFRCYKARVLLAPVGAFLVWIFPRGRPISLWFYCLVLLYSLASSLMSNMMFVLMGSFFSKISDSTIGGTYVTLLNTFHNLGGTWPKSLILFLIDSSTHSYCQPQVGVEQIKSRCSSADERDLCEKAGGSCVVERDGYQVATFVCLFLGICAGLYFQKLIPYLHAQKEGDWRGKKGDVP